MNMTKSQISKVSSRDLYLENKIDKAKESVYSSGFKS